MTTLDPPMANKSKKTASQPASTVSSKETKHNALSSPTLHTNHPIAPLPDSEIFIGLVGPTGTDLDTLIDKLREELANLEYATEVVSLSSLIAEFSRKTVPNDEYQRIKFLMAQGTDLCRAADHGDFVGRLGVADIRRRRTSRTGKPEKPAGRVAYVIRSFKRKEEVTLYRRMYGKAFNLVSAFSSAENRRKSLARKLSKTSRKAPELMEPNALELINTDYAEEAKTFGQSVRDTFPLADYFVTVDSIDLGTQVKRFVELIFGNPFLTPNRDEQAMFAAKAASLRSADLSRQVGAVITSRAGELLATGCNEVPSAGGGLYWSDDAAPARDIERGFDTNAQIKTEIVQDLLSKLRSGGWLRKNVAKLSDEAIYRQAALDREGILKEAQILDVIEFGRAVHAEMAALSDAAKRGVSTQSARLFCTTFPCHICARHIVAAGIEEVVYVEPYPKSRTAELFPDSIELGPTERGSKVRFTPFVGAAPRRYFDWFELVSRRKDDAGKAIDWPGGKISPKFERFVLSYLLMEEPVVLSLEGYQGARRG